MRRLTAFLAVIAGAACAPSPRSQSSHGTEPPAPSVIPARTGHADIDLTGEWATGSGGEPAAKLIMLQPPCNESPAVWILEQDGDTVSAWMIPASYSKGTASNEASSSAARSGWVSGVDLVIPAAGASYLLRYDPTSEHLRGTFNGAPFWAVRLEIVRPQHCIPPP